jgi:TolB-like protein/class 3 adenylate cyclase
MSQDAPPVRRLLAILAADVAGYSRLVGNDEEGTVARLQAVRRDLIDPLVAQHRGRIVKSTGDGILAEFASVVDAVRCAIEAQNNMVERNADVQADTRIEFRIGINLGDVIAEDGDIFGDGVNVAARLEGLAEPGGICVSRAVRDQVRDKLDCQLEDMGELEVKNIARPVRAFRIGVLGARPPASTAAMVAVPAAMPTPSLAPPLPEKPSIAIMPFQNLSGDPEQEYFVDGMVEEIITALSRIRWLFVIARSSSFTYKGQAVAAKQIGRELGVRYLLEGSVRKAIARVRITGRLIDAVTAGNLWADRFDGSLDDIFDLQDQVASSVAGVIEPALHAAESARTAAHPTDDLAAYDLYLRGYEMVLQSTARVGEALDLMERAIARDPRYGPALAWAAHCCFRLRNDRSEDREAYLIKGKEFARRALEVAGNDPEVLTNSAQALASFGEDIDAMMALVQRALELNPSYARGWHISATLGLYAGQPELAVTHAETSLRLSPRANVGASHHVIGCGHFLSSRFKQAAPVLQLAIQEDPTFTWPYRVLAASYAHMGRLEEAKEIIARLRTITSDLIPDAGFLRNVEQRELFLSGLRQAVGNLG